MQKKRPRSKGSKHSGSGETSLASAESESPRRAVRVRSRLVAGVAVVGVTVIAAGAPAVLGASSDLHESQRLVTLAELNQQAIALAHALADERDEVTASLAAGRDEDGTAKEGKGDPGSRSARVDQRVEEIRAAAPVALRRDLSTIPSLRREALSGKGTASAAHQAYSEVIAKLQAVAEDIADRTPPRAAEATRAPVALGRATEQASATRGLLIAALSVPREVTVPQTDPFTGLPVQTQGETTSKDARTRDELSTAAQQARVRELSSLADFDQTANAGARDRLSSAVTGPEVDRAEKYLASLADRPELSETDQQADRKKVEAALSARIDRMRSVESALGTAQVQRLEQLRDDDVTALELRVALLGGCLLLAVAVATAVARTLTQPLAVLRIGAARLAAEPATAEPVRYTGRNDEFAQVVRSMNALHGRLQELLLAFDGRSDSLQTEHTELIAGREELAAQRAELQSLTADLSAQLERLKNTVHHSFVNLSLRNLGLVERQLGVIEGLEEREHEPERLATLFKLDHMATVMRRHSENMLVLAGAEHGHAHAGPIPLVDVLRAAVSEIERYERVAIQSLPPHAQIAGFAADDLSHLVAELLENATSFSPPDSSVQLSGWLLETGEVMLSIQDEGIGMSTVRMGELNTRLGDPALFEAGEQSADGAGLGLQVTALLAARHGVRVELREHKGTGVTAVVVLPQTLLPKAPSAATPPPVKVAGNAPALNLPGSVAEANSNTLPGRTPGQTGDPLIAAAERAIRESGAAAEPGRETDGAPVPAAAETRAEVTMQVRLPVVPEPAEEAPGSTAPDPYAIGPDRHERTPDESAVPDPAPRPAPDPEPYTAPAPVPAPDPEPHPAPDATVPSPRQPEQPERLTDKGLPKRTPKVVKAGTAPGSERKGTLDKEALRLRLGGFHQGARDGRRDVEAEIAELTADPSSTGAAAYAAATGHGGPADHSDSRTDETGDTVEEARS
ncbi:nitrate- and nitrite sensing domain-containing protein [Streptomyces sp. NPDC052052]|uniref:sensor histidine kinase n=1 Tax=Streptomyces sp. NPDC052052 TaxID=3154756 RepID=UPI0034172E27